MSAASRMDDLPTEIISKCFSYAAKYTEDIKNLRLVSKRCNNISSPLLMDSVAIFITSPSLEQLEDISKHPTFSKAIKTVNVNVSYFDSILAKDLVLFAKDCSTNLFMKLDGYAHWGGDGIDTRLIYQTVEEWEALQTQDPAVDFTRRQQFLLTAHEEYIRRWKDQENLKMENGYFTKLAKALSRFPMLETVDVDDSVSYDCGWSPFVVEEGMNRFEEDEETGNKSDSSDSNSTEDLAGDEFSDQALMNGCLSSSKWKGSFQRAYLTSPPVEIISDLFQALEKRSIRPPAFTIIITPPTDMRSLKLTELQREIVKCVLRRSRHLRFEVKSWARKESLAVENSRPRDEMQSLCSFTTAFFASEALTSMTLGFYGYPAFHEVPQVSLADILPLSTPWPHLQELVLTHIPFQIVEMQVMVDKLKETLETCKLSEIWLLDGSWVDALDILRGLGNLKSLELKYPQGAEFRDRRGGGSRVFAQQLAFGYIMRFYNQNPLRGINLVEE